LFEIQKTGKESRCPSSKLHSCNEIPSISNGQQTHVYTDVKHFPRNIPVYFYSENDSKVY
jgi:hypothetical protein